EWTLSRSSNYSEYSFFLATSGSVEHNIVTNNRAVRPTFYLLSSTILNGGMGTATNPYRV
ncbi:MAG: hypothetical protein RSF02_02355, partial [Bacilli bacterium]